MRLAKGAKETFGWVILGGHRELIIPPRAWLRYGFQAGEQAIFIRGSSKSGGFGLTNRKLLAELSIPINTDRLLGYGCFSTTNQEFLLPEGIPVYTGDRLLTVFGSRYALGFITQGSIFEEAIRHPELEEFGKAQR